MGKSNLGQKRGKKSKKSNAAPAVGTTFNSVDIPILGKLSSKDDSERQCACTSLASIVLDENNLPHLLKNNVIGKLGVLLCDDNINVIQAAAGTLRNIAINAGPDVCQRMVSKDQILESLSSSLNMILGMLNQPGRNDENTERESIAVDSLDHILNVLWNICENSSDAIHYVNLEKLPLLVIQCISLPSASKCLQISAAQCLYTITEDNPASGQHLCKSQDHLKVIDTILSSDGNDSHYFLLKVLIAGTMMNVKSTIEAEAWEKVLGTVANVLRQVLTFNAVTEMTSMVKILQADTETNDSLMKRSFDDQLEKIANFLNAQQIALEIIANAFLSEEDDNDDNDEWQDLSDGLENEDEMEEDSDFNAIPNFANNSEVYTAFNNYQLPMTILKKIEFADQNLYATYQAHVRGRPLLRKLDAIQVRALSCLDNMFSLADVDLQCDQDALEAIWNALFQLGFGHTESIHCRRTDHHFMESVICTMRSLLQRLYRCNSKCLNEEQLTALAEYLNNSSISDHTKAGLVGLLGIAGQMAKTWENDSGLQVLRLTGTVLCVLSQKEDNLWLAAEAVDSLIDIFADGNVADTVAKQLRVVEHLQQLLPRMKSKMKSERANLGKKFHFVDNVRLNLVRFIKYKNEQTP
ncbi:HEAT repeat-containing protein 3 [Trichoplax sp. H2]|nr:HEAT repeat-containing protein 3 [Trichoplax sp. H2]|eukprot:RDD37581.1 HEAT repeat-containing protein 3 [Trichoplax sp. H2]